jgi:hypothetical protein
MAFRFDKHYTRDEARALLPQIRSWLKRLNDLQPQFDQCEQRLDSLRAGGADLGGELVNRWIRTMADMQETLVEFFQRELQLKDLERGLVDFPSLLGSREVFLCWEQDEEDVEFWHDLDTGYAAREKLSGED